jgi:peptidyl-prolyl cis-trans isomerase SurA
MNKKKEIMNKLLRFTFITYSLLLIISYCSAQAQPIDQIMAVVGDKIILQSDIEKQYNQYLLQNNNNNNEVKDENVKCEIFRQLLLTKLMLHQAAIDSVTVTDSQVESELDKRMRYYIKIFKTEKELEDYFHSSILELKAELRDAIHDQLVVQTMQGKITKEVVASPSEVKAYFKAIPKDSLPYINAEIQIAEIVKIPPVSNEEMKRVKDEMEEFRREVNEGKDFAVLAALYSQDPASAKKGGELGFFERGQMVPEFEAAAFSLKTPGEMSPIVYSKFGVHLIQLIERQGNRINVRHILLQPRVTDADRIHMINLLDSIRGIIANGSMTFEEAAAKFSDDESTRNNGGLMINTETGTTTLSPDQMDRILFFQIDTMPLNRISEPLVMQTDDGKQAYRIVKVISRTQPHVANMVDDYQKIQDAAQSEKQNKTLKDWVDRKRKTTYIHINNDYGKCSDLRKDWETTNN